jgi:hypothetical protein
MAEQPMKLLIAAIRKKFQSCRQTDGTDYNLVNLSRFSIYLC